jgi:hypothetical protein
VVSINQCLLEKNVFHVQGMMQHWQGNQYVMGTAPQVNEKVMLMQGAVAKIVPPVRTPICQKHKLAVLAQQVISQLWAVRPHHAQLVIVVNMEQVCVSVIQVLFAFRVKLDNSVQLMVTQVAPNLHVLNALKELTTWKLEVLRKFIAKIAVLEDMEIVLVLLQSPAAHYVILENIRTQQAQWLMTPVSRVRVVSTTQTKVNRRVYHVGQGPTRTLSRKKLVFFAVLECIEEEMTTMPQGAYRAHLGLHRIHQDKVHAYYVLVVSFNLLKKWTTVKFARRESTWRLSSSKVRVPTPRLFFRRRAKFVQRGMLTVRMGKFGARRVMQENTELFQMVLENVEIVLMVNFQIMTVQSYAKIVRTDIWVCDKWDPFLVENVPQADMVMGVVHVEYVQQGSKEVSMMKLKVAHSALLPSINQIQAMYCVLIACPVSMGTNQEEPVVKDAMSIIIKKTLGKLRANRAPLPVQQVEKLEKRTAFHAKLDMLGKTV